MHEALFSVITPVHEAGNVYLDAAFQSLCAQTEIRWTWRILTNHGGSVPAHIVEDPRVSVDVADPSLTGVGALKRHLALLEPKLPYTVELDCDDLLAPKALEKILAAFQSNADFVYSDCVEVLEVAGQKHARYAGYPYGEQYGWSHYEVEAFGGKYIAMNAAPVTAHNLRLVLWAPNHVRAWRTSFYENIGGHDASLFVADDHDLCVRFFVAGAKFVHIPEALYYYRVHSNNTVKTHNAAIQNTTWDVYAKHIWKLVDKFASDRPLLQKVDLCGGVNSPHGFRAVDKNLRGGSGIEMDLDGPWSKIKDDSVSVIRAYDAIEHLKSPVHTMNEAFRVLAPGGFFMISVPSTNGKGAWCDPTHVSFWNDLSFRYYTDQAFARFIPEFKGRFQLIRCMEWFPSEWHKQNNVPYVEANLVKLGLGYEPMGEVLWPTRT